jgi:hypothetical protein
MTIKRTIDVPASRRLTLDVPPEIPVGKVLLTFTPAQEASPKESLEQLTAELRDLCKDSTLTTERFLEMRREDLELEEAEYRRIFGKHGATL